jgi:hypothetical protein
MQPFSLTQKLMWSPILCANALFGPPPTFIVPRSPSNTIEFSFSSVCEGKNVLSTRILPLGMKVTVQPSVEKMASLNSCDFDPHTSFSRLAYFWAEAVSALAAAISRSMAPRTDVGITGTDESGCRERSCASRSEVSLFRASSVLRLIAS